MLLPCIERAAMYAGGGAAASFGSAWLCVLERGARGCARPLAAARGPVARHGSNSLAYVLSSTRLDMQLQDTAHFVKTRFKTHCCGSILAAPLLTGFGGQQWGQVLVRTS